MSRGQCLGCHSWWRQQMVGQLGEPWRVANRLLADPAATPWAGHPTPPTLLVLYQSPSVGSQLHLHLSPLARCLVLVPSWHLWEAQVRPKYPGWRGGEHLCPALPPLGPHWVTLLPHPRGLEAPDLMLLAQWPHSICAPEPQQGDTPPRALPPPSASSTSGRDLAGLSAQGASLCARRWI